MGFRDWTLLFAATGHLALALASISRAGKNPLALPFALLAFDLFGFTFATFCNHQLVGAHEAWRTADVVLTALAPAFILNLVLTFVGKSRRFRIARVLTFALFGLLALSSATAFVTASGTAWIESRAWAFVFLAAWAPTFVVELWFLWAHLRSSADVEEQARTRLIFAALFVGGIFASTDIWNDAGFPLPGLAPIGTLVSTSLVAVVALRLRLFDRNLSTATTLYAGSISVAAVVVYLTLFHALRSSTPALTFGILVVTLFFAAVVREATTAFADHRQRVDQLAILGRFSAQMAHDLKNPLAALVGAVQFLESDTNPESATSREFRGLIVEQAKRIRTVVDTYDRVARVEPLRVVVNVNDLVRRVTALQQYAAVETVKLSLELSEDVTDAELDPDLISGALENLVRNAIEAMPGGGTIVVRTSHERDTTLVLSVTDTGEGIEARNAERAFDDFFTTKQAGSGLGLAFVRRVAIAHGGDALLESKRGAGTKVEIRILDAGLLKRA
ncbi:MAG: ATP-binding protein [Polyangiaceae bacterium]